MAGHPATVWVAYYLDYEQSCVSEIATTRDALIAAVKASYGPSYVVEWHEEDGGSLIGEFEAVSGKSTKHTGCWSIDEYPLHGEDG